MRLSDFDVPNMVAIVSAQGTGSKLFQSLLDSHPQIYMIPAYPLMYFYPHWFEWIETLGSKATWKKLIDLLCIKHASVIDSRKIKGHNGLTQLGSKQDEFVSIDEDLFRSYLEEILTEETINSRSFLLAIHYAYSLCKNEPTNQKKILVYHIHSSEFLAEYLLNDFPDVKVIATTRDPRPNFERRCRARRNVDQAKLNETDIRIYRSRIYKQYCQFASTEQNRLKPIPNENVKMIRHEDIGLRRTELMKEASRFIGIDFLPTMLELTFDGKEWWGDSVYNMKLTNEINPTVISSEWKNEINKVDWFVTEGLFYEYIIKYKYNPTFKYVEDTLINKIKLLLIILVPSRIEREAFLEYVNPSKHWEFIKIAWAEASKKKTVHDYSWSATHLYKHSYRKFKLARRIEEFIPGIHNPVESISDNPISFLYKLIYVLVKYSRFLWSTISYPLQVVNRILILYTHFLKRIKHSNHYPDILGHSIEK